MLLNRLEIPLAGPGFIHIGASDRGFDEAWSKEMTSERKEIVFRGGVQRTVWRRISTSQPNDAWDLTCMTLILIESMKLRFTEETKPDYFEPKVAEEGNGKPGQSAKPQWGAMPGSGVLLADGMSICPKVPVGSVPQPQDKPRSPWGTINRPIEW
jgi:hypothetical protein